MPIMIQRSNKSLSSTNNNDQNRNSNNDVSSRYYTTVVPVRHLTEKWTPAGKATIESNIKKSKEKEEVKQEKRVAAVEESLASKKPRINSPQPVPLRPHTQRTLSALSYEDKCYSAQANFFLYSNAGPSFNIFTDVSFKMMLRQMNPNPKAKVPILTITHRCFDGHVVRPLNWGSSNQLYCRVYHLWRKEAAGDSILLYTVSYLYWITLHSSNELPHLYQCGKNLFGDSRNTYHEHKKYFLNLIRWV